MNKQKKADSFTDLISLSKDKKTNLLLLDLFLTAKEKAALETRILIIKELLRNEKTQRQIAKDLNVSIAKITRGSNELKRTSGKILKYLQTRLLG